MHETDIAVQAGEHRPVGHLRVALSDGDGVLLVQADQHLRVGVAEEVDEAVVQPAVARAWNERDILEVELAQERRQRVGTPPGDGWRKVLRPIDILETRDGHGVACASAGSRKTARAAAVSAPE